MINIQKTITLFFVLLILSVPGLTAEIHDVATKGDIAVLKKMLAGDAQLVHARDKDQYTPLHFASEKGHLEIVKLLLEKGADVNAGSKFKFTPLHVASYKGQKEAAEILVGKGADVHAFDIDNRTPLFFAAGSGNLELCKLLTAKGAGVNLISKHGRTPLTFAIMNKKKEVFSFLLEKGADIKAKDTHGSTPLHQVAENGQKELVEILLKKGADTKITDDTGRTPLHLAAFAGHTDIVGILIAKTENPDIIDSGGDTPLHGAAWGGHLDTVRFLLSKGADAGKKNKNGNTPLDNACKNGKKEIAELLLAGKAKSGKCKNVKSTDTGENKNKNKNKKMDAYKITVLYDNYSFAEGTKTDWGFSCLIEGAEKTILFDAGGKEETLLHNMKHMNVDTGSFDLAAISHDHWDHTGGLALVLKMNSGIPVYFPHSFPYDFARKVQTNGGKVVPVNEPRQICKNVWTTGEMGEGIKEQSLILDTSKGLVVITGCAHPGVAKIVAKAREMLKKDVYMVFGGFHLMRHKGDDVKEIISSFKKCGVKKCGATHCTGDDSIKIFREAYGENYVKMGTGRTLEIPR